MLIAALACITSSVSVTQVLKNILSLFLYEITLDEHHGAQGQKKRSEAAGHKGPRLTLHLTCFVLIASLVKWSVVYVSVVI